MALQEQLSEKDPQGICFVRGMDVHASLLYPSERLLQKKEKE